MRRRIVFAGFLLLLAGCINLGEGTREPVRLYTLQPTVSAEGSRIDFAGRSVGIGPVYLPEYLQRIHVVTLVPPNEFRLAGFAKWAEPLEDNILRVTAENLSRLLVNGRTLVFPWRGQEPDYRIRLDIRRFEAVAGDAAHLAVDWTIEPSGDGEAPRRGFFEGKSPLRGEEVGEVVEAMSRALGGLSQRLAEELGRFNLPSGSP